MEASDLETKETKKISKKSHKGSKLYWLMLIVFLLGVLSAVGLRFVTFKSDTVHYHANFALYVNGQRDLFKNFTFYEEVSACTSDDKDNPKNRVHMHDQNNGLVHVHAHGVTWGHFFANLNYVLGDDVLRTDNGLFVSGQDGKKLSFILNGVPVDTVANRVIKSEDRLLINYGNDDAKTLAARYKTVPNDAHEANTEHDPAACSGGEELTFWTRLKKSSGF